LNISVLDLNDNTPIFKEDEYHFNVTEEQSNSSFVGVVHVSVSIVLTLFYLRISREIILCILNVLCSQATDQDPGIAGQIQYKIIDIVP